MIKKLLLLFFLFSFCSSVLAELQVSLDHQQVTVDQSINLTLTSDTQQDGTPDFSPLQNDFEILGTSHKTEFLLINGKSQIKNQWIVTLMPKKAGDLTIPSLKYANTVTKPLAVKVTKKTNAPILEDSTQGEDIFMEAQVKPKMGFVQEQIIYTLKLFFRANLEEAYLFPPQLTGAHIAAKGQDIFYITIKNGRRFRVLERNYSITPQQSGNFTIKPPIFRGVVEQNPRDIFSMYDFMNNTRKQIKVTGPTIKIAIKAKPKSFQGQWWLPAKNVTVRDSWSSNPPKFKVGEPITQEITITALGARGDQLPPIPPPTLNNINVYPEHQQVETKGDDQDVVGILKQKITFVPTQAGKVRLPSISVPWWDVVNHKKQIASLPERIINVAPNALIKKPKKVAQSLAANIHQAGSSLNTVTIWFWWLLVAFIIGGLIWWVVKSKKRSQKETPPAQPDKIDSSHKDAYTLLKTACHENRPDHARQNLIAFVKAKWPDLTINNIHDFISIFQSQISEELQEEFSQLDRVLYAKEPLSWDGARFWTLFINFAGKNLTPKTQAQQDKLPPLYLE